MRGLDQNDSTDEDLDLEAGKEKGKQQMEDNMHKKDIIWGSYC